ncbi:MAG: hypothetical protein ACM362_09680, partial [Candidatus Methylomirabilota bacterium]
RDWAPDNTYTWTPSVPNPNYRVGVWVRSADATADAGEAVMSIPFAIVIPTATLTGLTADKTAPQPVGTPITFTASASGGITPLSFRWWVYDGTTWSLLRDWAPDNTYTWTPSVVNPNYRVGVWVRSAGATTDVAESALSIPFATVSNTATLTSLSADKTAPQPAGTPITFSAIASGGQTPYQTKWWLYNGTTWSLLRDWATGTSFTWTPTVANPNYLVGVWVRSAGATTDVAESALSIPFGITTGP